LGRTFAEEPIEDVAGKFDGGHDVAIIAVVDGNRFARYKGGLVGQRAGNGERLGPPCGSLGHEAFDIVNHFDHSEFRSDQDNKNLGLDRLQSETLTRADDV